MFGAPIAQELMLAAALLFTPVLLYALVGIVAQGRMG